MLKKYIKFLIRQYRLRTAFLRVLPDFIILGAQKAGTTSLDSYLRQHKDVKMSSTKEVHYFDLNYEKGIAWYKSFFDYSFSLNKKRISGEASPYYLVHPHVPKRIYETMPDVKMIIMLRNPIERAISHYYHEVRGGREDKEILEALNLEEERTLEELEKIMLYDTYNSKPYQTFTYKKRGIYVEQIKRFHKFFQKKQILIISSEELFEKPEETMKVVYEFLSIEKNISINYAPKNVGHDKKQVDAALHEYLKNYYQDYNEELYQYLGKNYNW